MITEFRGIDASTARRFMELYREQFEVWAREYRVRGNRCAIVFKSVPGAATLLDTEGRPVKRGVWLDAEVDAAGPEVRVVVTPATEHDAEMIERHCREMAPYVLH